MLEENNLVSPEFLHVHFFLPVMKTHHSKCYVPLDLNPEGRS